MNKIELIEKIGYYYNNNKKVYENIIHFSDVDDSYLACFLTFINSFNTFLKATYDDLQKPNVIFARSNINKVFIRNMIESILILDIFNKDKDSLSRFKKIYDSDVTRLNDIRKGQEGKKFLRRFSWLPKRKGENPSSVSDLLKFAHFENEENKKLYQILIRTLDYYVHPSFNLYYSFKSKLINDFNQETLFFGDGGILDELYEEFLNQVNDYFKDSPITIDHNINYSSIFQELYTPIPENVIDIFNGLVTLPNIIAESKTAHAEIIAYLLVDFSFRYLDFLISFYSNNNISFYSNLRTVLESLSYMHILMKEDENRCKVFLMHQNIKTYETTKALNDLFDYLGIETNLNKLEIEYETNINLIKKYYVDNFNKDINPNIIKRLNGWALFLKEEKNENLLNAMSLINNLLKDSFDEDKVNYYKFLFEESNCFDHVSNYAINKTNDQIDKEIINDLNLIIKQISYGIIKTLKIDSSMSDEMIERYNKLLKVLSIKI